jgi:hypothetical protein
MNTSVAEVKTTNEPYVEPSTHESVTTKSGLPIVTSSEAATQSTVTPTGSSQTISNLPEPFPGKRQMKSNLEVSDSEEEPTTSNPSLNATSFMNFSGSSGNDSFTTELPTGNESLAFGNHTGNEIVPTGNKEENGSLSTEIPANTGELSTALPTMEPEPTDDKPEPEKHVLDKL